MLRLLRLIAVLTAIPLIGIGLAVARFWEGPLGPGGLMPALSASLGCATSILGDPRGNACGDATAFGWLALVSTGVLILSFGIVPLSRLVATVLGAHRSILSIGFRPYAIMITLIVGMVSLIHLASSLPAAIWRCSTGSVSKATS